MKEERNERITQYTIIIDELIAIGLQPRAKYCIELRTRGGREFHNGTVNASQKTIISCSYSNTQFPRPSSKAHFRPPTVRRIAIYFRVVCIPCRSDKRSSRRIPADRCTFPRRREVKEEV